AGDALYGGPRAPLEGSRHALHASYVAWAGDDAVAAFAVESDLPADLRALGFPRSAARVPGVPGRLANACTSPRGGGRAGSLVRRTAPRSSALRPRAHRSPSGSASAEREFSTARTMT